VAAFRATLEEVLEADLIAHVRDVAHDESEAQKSDVLKVLAELGVPEDRPMVEVLNKIDLLPQQAEASLLEGNRRGKSSVAVSALTGLGVDTLLTRFESDMTHDNIELTLTLDSSDGAGLAWAYRHSEVVSRRERGGNIVLKLRISPQEVGRIEDQFPGKTRLNQNIAADL